MSARTLIIGGHGKIALLLEPILVNGGVPVTAVVRNPDHVAEVEETGATAVVADVAALDVDALADLFRGSDAIVWSAGAGGGEAARTYAVDRDAAIRSMDAAEAAGVSRYVMVSYFGAGPDHGVPEDDPFHAYAEAKAQADEHLRRSGLDWTILAPSSLTLDPPVGKIDVDAKESGSVARADVAAVIAAVLTDRSSAGRTIAFNTGERPIPEAVAG